VSVVVVGSANIDLVARTPVLPGPGETVLGSDFATIPGGKGANQAIAAARAGAATTMIAAVGDDPYGDRLRDTLAAAGVDTTAVRTVPVPTGTALISVADSGENSIIVIPGANALLTDITPTDLNARAAGAIAPDGSIGGGRVVVVGQLEVPQETVREAFAAVRAGGGMTVLNAAPAAEPIDGLLEVVDLLVVNEHEAAALAGGAAGDWAGLLERVPRVVVTLGEQGVRYAERGGVRHDVRAVRVAAVDTTAAGDTFTGALVAALDRGDGMERALRFGCAAASLCVEKAGASSSIPVLAEIEQRYLAAYGSEA
jgi:ribokinase